MRNGPYGTYDFIVTRRATIRRTSTIPAAKSPETSPVSARIAPLINPTPTSNLTSPSPNAPAPNGIDSTYSTSGTTVATAIAGDRELGCDAVQEAFARAVRKRRSFKGRGTLEAWVWPIVVNAARDARRRRPALAELRDAATNGHAPVLPLDLLTERQREIVFLHYYADLDYAAIADALEISPGTVGATLNAARKTLRRAFEEVQA